MLQKLHVRIYIRESDTGSYFTDKNYITSEFVVINQSSYAH
jgi:hypothetical protein